ncbi:ATP-dependent RNA helicase DbpA [Thiomicrospira cyclica]|uniref:DEAD/DEAH box helicase domain protein n=1 Tax=Thiomicrospira cyclica (strain DSM 14477 / JCM 11371 / ALM1) TaxID=717773 RepID=F6D8Y1_THICA|nr:ATP-dependent RNA helicase DbpA [Thiomicrospira cyclica]AEG31981.1 DEAD/DEAH box helicase domain protein [Thiomicrospira cyclica ALM1]
MNQPAQPHSFTTLNLHPDLLSNLESLGYLHQTEIQAQSLPPILAGQDVIAQGKTGSGKTAAFGLGLLNQLDSKNFNIQAMVLCPTRELADQVAEEIRRLARRLPNIKVMTLCGGMNMGAQLSSLQQGAHVIVGTPGRIEEHLRKQTLKLDDLKVLVLDEADRMLDMGFQPAIDAIMETVPSPRQTLLFSATFPSQIEQISERIMQTPLRIQVESQHDHASIAQHFYQVDTPEQRLTALRLLLLKHRPESSVVFCNTKKDAQMVADALHKVGFDVAALHGDLEQRERDQTLIQFANKSIAVLVATDVAARGLDIDALDAVINFHLAHDPEIHVHRIGRTGRAGSKGLAASLISDKESYKVAVLGEYLDQEIKTEPLPDLSILKQTPLQAKMVTLQLDGGKKIKLRPGDILGALTANPLITGEQIGKIKITDMRSYVAVERPIAKLALKHLSSEKLKGKNVRARML